MFLKIVPKPMSLEHSLIFFVVSYVCGLNLMSLSLSPSIYLSRKNIFLKYYIIEHNNYFFLDKALEFISSSMLCYRLLMIKLEKTKNKKVKSNTFYHKILMKFFKKKVKYL